MEFANRSYLAKAGLIFLLATAVSLVFVGQNMIAAIGAGGPVNWRQGGLFEVVYWYAFAPLLPLIIWAARRYRIERNSWKTALFKHFLCDIGATAVQILLTFTMFFGIIWAFQLVSDNELQQFKSRTVPVMIITSAATFWKYWIIVGFYYAVDYYRKYQEREAKSAQLEKSLALANLQNLKMQLHPHFLFNTLHAISVLMLEDTVAANRMLVRLGDLLRLAINTTDTQEVSLKEELDFIKRYLEIEKIRFRDRLNVNINIEPAAMDARVPYLLLQPLIENSIKHGISARKESGIINITAQRSDSVLQLTVSDNGTGFSNGKPEFNSGIGLSNTKARLENLYGDNYKLDLSPAVSGGLVVSITLPFTKTSPSERFNEEKKEERESFTG